jgi:hypothetical protein
VEAKDIFALTRGPGTRGRKMAEMARTREGGLRGANQEKHPPQKTVSTGHPMTHKGKNKPVRSIMGLKVFFANKVIQSKRRRDSHLYVISDRFYVREALALYRMRCGIEQLFRHLKKRCFDLEVTHVTKLVKLFAVVSLAFLFSSAWSYQLRKIRKSTAPIKRKSIFRIGLEGILRLLNNPHPKEKERREFSDWLTSPIFSSIFVVSCVKK